MLCRDYWSQYTTVSMGSDIIIQLFGSAPTRRGGQLSSVMGKHVVSAKSSSLFYRTLPKSLWDFAESRHGRDSSAVRACGMHGAGGAGRHGPKRPCNPWADRHARRHGTPRDEVRQLALVNQLAQWAQPPPPPSAFHNPRDINGQPTHSAAQTVLA